MLKVLGHCHALKLAQDWSANDVEVTTACESSSVMIVHGCNYLNTRANFYENKHLIQPAFYMIIHVELITYSYGTN